MGAVNSGQGAPRRDLVLVLLGDVVRDVLRADAAAHPLPEGRCEKITQDDALWFNAALARAFYLCSASDLPNIHFG